MKEYEKPQMEIIELSGAGVITNDPVIISGPWCDVNEGDDGCSFDV